MPLYIYIFFTIIFIERERERERERGRERDFIYEGECFKNYFWGMLIPFFNNKGSMAEKLKSSQEKERKV